MAHSTCTKCGKVISNDFSKSGSWAYLDANARAWKCNEGQEHEPESPGRRIVSPKKAITEAATLLGKGVGIALCFWTLFVSEDAYRAHTWFFITIWLLLPVLAYFTANPATLRGASVLKMVSVTFVTASALLSLAGLANFDQIRDSIGKRYVSGYVAVPDVDYDSYGAPFRTTTVFTDQWYTRYALGLFEWTFILACFGLPALTHIAVKRGSTGVPLPVSPQITGRALGFLQQQQALRPSARLEGIFFTNEAAWAYLENGGRAEALISNPEKDLFLMFTNLPMEEAEEIEKASRREERLP
jgi:hypothetical protein